MELLCVQQLELLNRTILCTSNPTSEMKTGSQINTHEQIKKTSSPKVGGTRLTYKVTQ